MNEYLSHPTEVYEYLRQVRDGRDLSDWLKKCKPGLDAFREELSDPDDDTEPQAKVQWGCLPLLPLPPSDPSEQVWESYCLAEGLTGYVGDGVGWNGEPTGVILKVTAKGSATLALWDRERAAGGINGNNRIPTDEQLPPILAVNLETFTITFDGQKHEVNSELSLRWVKVLADRPGEWVSASELKRHDQELDGFRPDRAKNRKLLPAAILTLIESHKSKGSRLKLPVRP